MFQIVAIADITINERKRVANPAKVQQLAESIEGVGLLNPVTITASNVLVAGLHRLAACTSLGWTVIPARILDLEGLEAELAEIDENLIRAELTELQQGVQLARRKEIYEALHPETAKGAAQANGMNRSRGHDVAEIISATFATDTAAKTGQTDRTIRNKTRIGEQLSDVADDLAGSAIEDSQKDLLALAALAPDERKEVIESVVNGETPDTTEGWREKIEERRPAPRTTYPCSSCGSVFTDPVWHCPRCDHHWPMHRIDCLNCHEYSRPPLPNEMASDDDPQSRNVPTDHQRINQSNSNEWYTPPDYIEAARELLGDIDTDPASNDMANGWIKAATYHTKETNGFDKPWPGRVWMNPPYGKEEGERDGNQARWTARLIEQFRDGTTTEAVCLVNAVPGNAWFAPLWDFPICFPRQRIKFTAPDKDKRPAPTHSNALVYLGDNVAGFVRIFSQFGPVVHRLSEHDGRVSIDGIAEEVA